MPGPTFKGTNIPSDYFYFSWVDRENTLGLGRDVPIIDGTGSDSLIAFDPTTKKFVTIRVPYPMGFYTRSMDGRIDDPNGGWKGGASGRATTTGWCGTPKGARAQATSWPSSRSDPTRSQSRPSWKPHTCIMIA